MKKQTLSKIEKARKKIAEAADLLNAADEKLYYEDTVALSQNMTVQDAVTELYKRTKELADDIQSTINAIKDTTNE